MNIQEKFTKSLHDFADLLRADGHSARSYFEELSQVMEKDWPSADAKARVEAFLNPRDRWHDANFSWDQMAQYGKCWQLGLELIPRRNDFDMTVRQEVIEYLSQSMDCTYDYDHSCLEQSAFENSTYIVHCASAEGNPQDTWELHNLWVAGEKEVEDGEAERVGEVMSASAISVSYCPFCGEKLARGVRA